MKKHIALFLPNLVGGGAEKVIVTLANELEQHGYQVDFVLVKAAGVNVKFVSRKIRIVDLNAPNAPASLPRLVAYLRKSRPDVLLSSLDLTNLTALIARSLAGVDVFLAIRVDNTISMQKRSFIKKKLEKHLMTWIYPWADMVIAVSNSVAEDIVSYAALSPSKIRVIYNPVVTPELFEKSREGIDHPWFRAGAPPVILGVGRLTEQKNFSNLIRAFSAVRDQIEAHLVILGEGEQRPVLEALVRSLGLEDDVEFAGYVENPYSYMHQSEVFVLSSNWEGLPTVMIEALACGVSVISTDCPGGVVEILDGGRLGRLVPINDAGALAGAILETLKSRPPQTDPARLHRFSVEATVRHYIRELGIQ